MKKVWEYLHFCLMRVRSDTNTLREKCPYSELFWSAFSHIGTEYGEMIRISPYSVRMREKKGPE